MNTYILPTEEKPLHAIRIHEKEFVCAFPHGTLVLYEKNGSSYKKIQTFFIRDEKNYGLSIYHLLYKNNMLFVSGEDGSVAIFKKEYGVFIKKETLPKILNQAGFLIETESIAYDKKTVYVSDYAGCVYTFVQKNSVWVQALFMETNDTLYTLAVKKDILVSGGEKGILYIYNTKTKKEVAKMLLSFVIYNIAFLTEETVVIVGEKGFCCLYNLRTKKKDKLTLPPFTIEALAILTKNTFLLGNDVGDIYTVTKKSKTFLIKKTASLHTHLYEISPVTKKSYAVLGNRKRELGLEIIKENTIL